MERDKNIAAYIEQISDGEQPPAHLLAGAAAQLKHSRQSKQIQRRRFILSFAAAAAVLLICIFTPIAVWLNSNSANKGTAPEDTQPNTEFSYTLGSLTAESAAYAELPNAGSGLFPAFTHVFGDVTEADYTLYTFTQSGQPAYAEMRSRRVSDYGYEEIYVYTLYSDQETDIFDAYRMLNEHAGGIVYGTAYEGVEYTLRLRFSHAERAYYMVVLSAKPFQPNAYVSLIRAFVDQNV